MCMEFFLGLIVLFLLVNFFIIFKGDLFSPTIILTIGYFIAIATCIMNIEKWNVNIHTNTVFLICLGIVSFAVGEIFFRMLVNKKRYNSNVCKKENKIIIISNNIIFVIFLINIVVIFAYLKEIIRISNVSNINILNFSNMMNSYRQAYSYGDASVSTIAVQLMKFSKSFAYIFLYIFFNNIFLINKDNFKKQIKYLIPVVMFLICGFLQGGRANFLAIVVACIFLFYYNYNRKYNFNKNLSFKVIKNIIFVGIVFLVLFYASKQLVGRVTNKNFFDYITTYLGGSVQLLDEYLNDSTVEKRTNYNETFPGIIQSLYKLKIINHTTKKSLEFRHVIDGEYLGNVYTGLRRYYNDWGYLGVIFIEIIYSFFCNWLYYNIKHCNRYTYKNIFRTTFYSSMIYCIFIQAIEEHFLISLSFGYIIELIILYVLINMVIKNKNLKEVKNV